jgi:hypothetical protein
MKDKHKHDKKVFCSMTEFEKEYFPNSYEQKLTTSRSDQSKAQGTGLAIELLETIRRKLKK